MNKRWAMLFLGGFVSCPVIFFVHPMAGVITGIPALCLMGFTNGGFGHDCPPPKLSPLGALATGYVAFVTLALVALRLGSYLRG